MLRNVQNFFQRHQKCQFLENQRAATSLLQRILSSLSFVWWETNIWIIVWTSTTLKLHFRAVVSHAPNSPGAERAGFCPMVRPARGVTSSSSQLWPGTTRGHSSARGPLRPGPGPGTQSQSPCTVSTLQLQTLRQTTKSLALSLTEIMLTASDKSPGTLSCQEIIDVLHTLTHYVIVITTSYWVKSSSVLEVIYRFTNPKVGIRQDIFYNPYLLLSSRGRQWNWMSWHYLSSEKENLRILIRGGWKIKITKGFRMYH